MMVKDRAKTVGVALDDYIVRLAQKSDTPALDAQGLLAHVMKKPRSWIMAHPEERLSASRAAALETLVANLENGDPLPYVLGRWEFFGLEFDVTPDVLIPRPETELLVERAIAWLKAHPEDRYAVDIGTGSGCIGIAMAANIPDLKVTASDISAAALEMAQHNAAKNGVRKRMEFVCCDLFPPQAEYNLIVANLPYIPTKKLKKLPIYGHEPTMALNGGADGMDLIRRLLNAAPDRLVPGGFLLMEIEASEGSAALSLAFDAFEKADIHLHKDLSGRDRILEVQV